MKKAWCITPMADGSLRQKGRNLLSIYYFNWMDRLVCAMDVCMRGTRPTAYLSLIHLGCSTTIHEDVELSVFILHKTLCVDMNCETCHVRRDRYYKNYRLMSEAGSRWRPCGNCSDTSVRYQELLHNSDGRWLFETKGRVSSINILFQGGVQKDRLSKRLENNTIPYTNPSWLLDQDLELGLLNLHRALCNDLNCEICNGTEEERELQNQENMMLLFG